MTKNNKTSVMSVDVLHYDKYSDVYTVRYYLSIKAGVVRRRESTYSHSDGLLKGRSNEDLIEKIKQEIRLFNKDTEIKQYN